MSNGCSTKQGKRGIAMRPVVGSGNRLDRRARAALTPVAANDRCPFCGVKRSDEEMGLAAKHGHLQCPSCSRDGCFECMPSGRGCACPECEQGEEST